MFGIDFSEILVIFVIALVVLGPERLPKLANTIGRWIGRARGMARQFREQLEQEATRLQDSVHVEGLGPGPGASSARPGAGASTAGASGVGATATGESQAQASPDTQPPPYGVTDPHTPAPQGSGEPPAWHSPAPEGPTPGPHETHETPGPHETHDTPGPHETHDEQQAHPQAPLDFGAHGRTAQATAPLEPLASAAASESASHAPDSPPAEGYERGS